MADEVDVVALVTMLHQLSPEAREQALRLASLADHLVQKASIKATVSAPKLAQRTAKAPVAAAPVKRRGRKPGSKNKSKQGQGGLSAPAADPVAQSLHERAEQL